MEVISAGRALAAFIALSWAVHRDLNLKTFSRHDSKMLQNDSDYKLMEAATLLMMEFG